MVKWKKVLYIILGSLSIIFGIIGIFLPGIPTTPFMLLALWCFSHSWLTMYNKLKNSKLIRKHVNKNGVSLKYKIYSIVIMASMVTLSACLHWNNKAISFSIIGAGIIGFIFMMKHIKVNKNL